MSDSAIFKAAIKLTPEQRAAYLKQACGDNVEQRREVEALLQAHDASICFLEAPPDRPAAIVEGPGTRIGPYKLLQPIGEGGMGVVHMAEQQEPVRRKVALKIIKPGMDSRQVIARFEAERQALAMMDHQNIARVLDAGTTDTGRPYFVMELVHGISLTKYCDDNQLTPRQRLELFVPICQAIQHAHQKGIIHRDIKPSNILVTMYDDRPVPKVIDFGVAKAIEQPLTEKTLFTQYGTMVGTFEYMSPEQAEMNAFGVDTRSDIYSLGVLLYELLTGTTPLDRQRLREAAFGEIVRLIKEEEPPRPSTRLSRSGASLATISRQRGSEPEKLTRLVRGELDWIVMRCLEKDRTRRYETASGLARDVERYLRDEPVEACPPTSGYRLRKFARKHQKLLATAAAFILLLLLGVAVSVWQAVRATQAEAEANANADQAEQKEQEASKERDAVKVLNEKVRVTQGQLRRTLYGAHMNLAQHAWEAGRISRVLELLELQRPGAEDTDLRNFEWHYFGRLCHSDVLSLERSPRLPANSDVAFSPDFQRLASYGGVADLKAAKVWDVRTGKELLTLKGHIGPVRCVAFSPDGKRLASGSAPIGGPFSGGKRNGEWKVWDALTGRELATGIGHTDMVTSVAFSPDGKKLASASHDQTVRVWDLQADKELLTLRGHTGTVWSVAFSPDGKKLASASHDQTVKVWDLQAGKELLTLQGHSVYAFTVTFSPDGKRLASGGGAENGGLKLWDVQTGKELLNLKAYAVQVNCVAFSPDGKCLASGANDLRVKVWDTQTGRELRTFLHDGLVQTVVFSPDGTRLAAAAFAQTVRIWDMTTNPPTRTFTGHTGPVVSVAFSPDGKRLASGSCIYDESRKVIVAGEVKVSDVRTGKELLAIRHTTPISSLVFSPDGKRLAGAYPDRASNIFQTPIVPVGTVTVWDAESGRERLSLKSDGTCVAFNPDGKYLAGLVVTSEVKKVKRKTDGKEQEGFHHSVERTVKVWDEPSGKEFLSLKGVGPRLAFSPDGKRLANGGAGPVIVWNAHTGQELLSFGGPDASPRQVYGDVAFSPDGKWLASTRGEFPGGGAPGLGEVMVFDTRTNQEILRLKGLTGHIRSVVFSPDSQRLAAADWWDNTVKVWDVQTGQELLTLVANADSGNVASLAFSPDGHRLASNVMIWDARPLPEKP